MKFTEGQQVEVINQLHGHQFKIGTTVTITKCYEDDNDYIAKDNKGVWWCVEDDELKAVDSVEPSTRDLLQSILDNAVHIGGTDYRISEDVINKIREVLK